MVKTKYDVLTRNGKEKFVVIPMTDYEQMLERLEDARDLRDLDAARARNAGKPGISHEQMLKELGLKPTRRKSKARV
jgi:PHD/YefM family antitoxin component YafN of YafNO toxin-antitoxin module